MIDDYARVKAAVDIVDVVGQYVQLTRSGSRLVGLCPFHTEKTGSFHVHPKDQFFKCFGCNEGGDVFEFLKKIERIESREALRRLAERAGISLSSERPEARKLREKQARLLTLMERAAFHYRAAGMAAGGRAGIDFLLSRGLSAGTLDLFGAGFAPPQGNYLALHLRKDGFSESELVDSGLCRSYGAGLRDIFRDRVIIPIRDDRGRPIAFGGRRLVDGPTAPDPKYLNSAENAAFHKSQVLFGLDLASEAIRGERRAVLVEGYLDVMAAHQQGLQCAVGTMGTSVTKEHGQKLKRLTEKLVLCLDSDEAGQRAAGRAIPILLAEGLEVDVLALRDCKDPGDYFTSGQTREDFETLLKADSLPALQFLLKRKGASQAKGVDERARIARDVMDSLSNVRDALQRAALIRGLAVELDLPGEALQRVATRSPRTDRQVAAEVRTQAAGLSARDYARREAEEHLLVALIQDSRLRAVAEQVVEVRQFSHPVRMALFKMLVQNRGESSAELELRVGEDPDAAELFRRLAATSVFTDPGQVFDGMVKYFQRIDRERRSEEWRVQIREHERSGDPRQTLEALKGFEQWKRHGSVVEADTVEGGGVEENQ